MSQPVNLVFLKFLLSLIRITNGAAYTFIEKPTPEVAEQLIEQGSLWNCGVFCFRLGYLKSVLEHIGYHTSYEHLKESFGQLPKRSFDYEVVERTKSIVVKPYNGSWKDLGTWEALTEEIHGEFVGRGEAVDCTNTHVINELGIPLVAMGLSDAVVVKTS